MFVKLGEAAEKRCPAVSNNIKSSQSSVTANTLEASINHLEEMERNKYGLKDYDTNAPRIRNRLVDLVGNKCVVSCNIDGVEVLWDTGAQVSLVSERWLSDNLGRHDVDDLETLLQEKLSVEAVGGHKIPYKGVVTLKVQLRNSDVVFDVPFLVTRNEIDQPIVGYNVLEAFVGEGATLRDCLLNIPENKINSVVNLLKTMGDNQTLSEVSILKKGVKLRPGQIAKIPVKIKVEVLEEKAPVLFEPSMEHPFSDRVTICSNVVFLKGGVSSRMHVTVVNRSNKEVNIPGRMVIGSICLAKSVTPVEVTMKDPKSKEKNNAVHSKLANNGSNKDDGNYNCNDSQIMNKLELIVLFLK